MGSKKESMAVVLAAGKGTRMQSELPKVLVPVSGRPMVRFVVDALRAAGVQRIVVVVGHRADLVRQELADEENVEFAEQAEQLGTGHAVMMCRDQLENHEGAVVVVAGDSPLLQAESVAGLLIEFEQRQNAACLLGTVKKNDPAEMGRIVRDDAGNFVGIVEEKDATPEQKKIREINVSTYVFDCKRLLEALNQLSDDNAQGEYYITDCPTILLREGYGVAALDILQPCESLSINDMDDLRAVEAELEAIANVPSLNQTQR